MRRIKNQNSRLIYARREVLDTFGTVFDATAALLRARSSRRESWKDSFFGSDSEAVAGSNELGLLCLRVFKESGHERPPPPPLPGQGHVSEIACTRDKLQDVGRAGESGYALCKPYPSTVRTDRLQNHLGCSGEDTLDDYRIRWRQATDCPFPRHGSKLSCNAVEPTTLCSSRGLSLCPPYGPLCPTQ